MCKYRNPRQFAYINPGTYTELGKFCRLGVPILSEEQMQACVRNIPHIAAYESVYGWTGWKGGLIDQEISKTALIDGVFIDFDDKHDPLKAIRDAAEVAAYVGHSVINFSGKKGAHLFIRCYPVDLVPDLKSSVLRMFVNNLADRLPELDTIDWSVAGDTTRVKRVIDTVHPETKLHAIGLTEYELATLTFDEVRDLAANRRDLEQVIEPSRWVSDELMKIEGEVLHSRLNRLIDSKVISSSLAGEFISDIYEGDHRNDVYRAVYLIEEHLQRIRMKNAPPTDGITGRTKAETWLLKVVAIFKVVQRMNSIRPKGSKVSTSASEHKARCHIVHLMDDCRWTRSDMHNVLSNADDYDSVKTERQINSLIGR